jgi:hypothetical protein
VALCSEGGLKVAKKAARKSTAKRDLVSRKKGSAYAKRTARGRFKEMDDVGRSQKADRPRKAKRAVKSGYGDQGDQKSRARKTAKSSRRSR